MIRIKTPTGLFKNANAYTKTGGTTITADWLNSIQEELCNVITSTGISLKETSNTQLLDAIYNIIKTKAVNADWDATYGGSQILNKPSTFTPSVHEHVAADIQQDSTHRFVTDSEKSILSSGGFESAGTASTLLASHVASIDPHPVYTTAQELSSILTGYSLTNHTHLNAYEPANSNIQDHIASISNPHNTTATQVTFTPYSTLSSINVQSAIQELRDETQPLDATLTALAGVTTAADKLIYSTAADTFSTTTLTSAARSLLDDANITTMRTTLGLGSIATQASSLVSISGGTISGITDIAVADGGTGASDAATARTNLGAAATGGKLSQFAATTSAELAGVISDETGSGSLVFATSPTLTTPNIGVATGTSFNSITGLGSSNPVMDGTATVGTSTLVSRQDHVHPTDTTRAATSGTLAQFAATTSSQLAGIISDETGSGSLVFGTEPSIDFALGTAAAPSIKFNGDTDTGLWSPGANIVAVSIGGSEAVRVTANRNILIGTTTDSSYKLLVVSAKTDGSPSGQSIVTTQTLTTSANLNATGLYSTVAGTSIPTGVTSSGYTVAILAEGNINNAAFQGTLTSQYGLMVKSGIYSCGAGATITSSYGLHVNMINADADATITNSYGAYIDSLAAAGTITNRWGIYQVGALARNYYQGRSLFGTTVDDGISIIQANGYVKSLSSLWAASSTSRLLLENTDLGDSSKPFMYISNSNGDMIFGNANRSAGQTTSSTELMRLTTGGRFLAGTATENTTTGNAKIQSGNGIYLGNTANLATNVLDWYEEGTFTATATGMTTSPTGTVSYVRVGNTITIYLPGISGTSNATTFTLTGGPTSIRPSATRNILLRVNDNNGAYTLALAAIGTDGTITLYKDITGAAFTSSGTKGTSAISLSYIL